jgi:hypothetical protein
MVVCISVGVPGARWITIKEIRVMPKSMGTMNSNRFKR